MSIRPVALLECLKEDLAEAGLPTEGGEFWPGIGIQEAAAVNLLNSFLKKLRTGRTADTDNRALEKFLACNRACEEWVPDMSVMDTKLEIIIGTVRQYLDDFWHRNGLDLIGSDFDVLERGALGPGVSIGSRGNDFYTKLFSSPLTVSDLPLYLAYRLYIWNLPEWSIAEQIRYLEYGEACVVKSSRLSFVPKNDEISRCICIEPTLNVFYQLGLGRILEDRLAERFGISLATQPFVNRALARLGSITDGLATLDLSSASDSISVSMLRFLLPKRFMHFLERYRSTAVDVKGRGTVPLGMISTMGNGYTFPLQTMLFSAVVLACLKWRGIPSRPGPSFSHYPVRSPDPAHSTRASDLWSVFGDDIICPSACAEDVVNTLTFLGFKVNQDKSFVKGPFRESCGSDFFNGSEIRGVYVKTLSTPEARYSVINLLTRFSTKTGIRLRRTIRALVNTVDYLVVPPWEDYSSGIHVPETMSRHLPVDKNLSRNYYARVPSPKKVRFKDGYVVVPRGCKQRIWNPPGLLISFLQGSISSASCGLREEFVRYRTKRMVAPSWEPSSIVRPESNDFGLDWGQWATTVIDALEIE